MVIIYNYIVTGAYKPIYNWGASHCIQFWKQERPGPRDIFSLDNIDEPLWYIIISLLIVKHVGEPSMQLYPLAKKQWKNDIADI